MSRIPTPPPLPPQISHGQFLDNWLWRSGLFNYRNDLKNKNINTIIDLSRLSKRHFIKFKMPEKVFFVVRHYLKNDGIIYNEDKTITIHKGSIMEYWFNHPL
jgi:hypothetical protein